MSRVSNYLGSPEQSFRAFIAKSRLREREKEEEERSLIETPRVFRFGFVPSANPPRFGAYDEGEEDRRLTSLRPDRRSRVTARAIAPEDVFSPREVVKGGKEACGASPCIHYRARDHSTHGTRTRCLVDAWTPAWSHSTNFALFALRSFPTTARHRDYSAVSSRFRPASRFSCRHGTDRGRTTEIGNERNRESHGQSATGPPLGSL